VKLRIVLVLLVAAGLAILESVIPHLLHLKAARPDLLLIVVLYLALRDDVVQGAALSDAAGYLSDLTSEYGRVIYPCKACVSTAMPLCHWPCSCYPNHAMGQSGDWMHELYPRWVAAHAVVIVTPVHWYQVPSVLKLMMDRLVCADGGNPDPTSTHGKHPDEAKALEMKGWSYPRHLEGRAFGVFVHGDSEGADVVRRALTDWLLDMHLVQAGRATVDRYIGYMHEYARSHDDLDADVAVQEEVRNVAREVVATVKLMRDGRHEDPGIGIREPRPK